ncbi:A24 family peptidase [Streptomyces sp. NPDC052000]|uniref:A24 family peptidase n=1 Tax=Streptomyces sp. NPDC052000 TaxID=3155676 RepID=UPI003450C901
MNSALIVLAAAWGAASGPLVPRAAYRLSVDPDESWREACPQGHRFTGPARGWLGRPVCGQRSFGAVLVVAGCCAALAGATGARPELAVWLLFVPFAVLLAGVDLSVRRLPDILTLPLAGVMAALLICAGVLPGHAGSWIRALAGGLALGGAYFVLFLINPNGLGFGDVKLAVTLGMVLGWYGWGILFLGAFAGFLLGAAYGLGLMVLRRAGRKDAIPFGPFMLGGAVVGVLLGALTVAS